MQQEVIYIKTGLGNWTYLSLTTDQLAQWISQRNVIVTGGQIDTDIGRTTITPSGDIDAVAQMNSIVVGTVGEGASQPSSSDSP